VLLSTLVVFALLGIGLVNFEQPETFFEMWIPTDSTVVEERAYTAYKYPALSESVFFLSTKFDDAANFVTPRAISELYQVTKRVLTETVYEHVNAETGAQEQYHWQDVCERPPSPASLTPLLYMSGINGLPCTKYSMLDCFAEGGVDNNLARIEST
jgi:hypothetical protein